MVALPQDTVEQMRKAPGAAFESPAAVLGDARLSAAQKRQVLEAWAHDCREQAIADDEGMPLRERTGTLLQEVEDALNRLSAHPFPGAAD